MKYLQLYDHLGNLVKEFEVYVDGQDFSWAAVKPEPVWLGTIRLVDVKAAEPVEPTPEPEPEELEPDLSVNEPEDHTAEDAEEDWKRDKAKEEVEVSTPVPFTTTETIIEEVPVKDLSYPKEEVFCEECGLTGAREDFPFGHDDIYCWECGIESMKPIEEVKREPKKPSDKGRRSKRSSS